MSDKYGQRWIKWIFGKKTNAITINHTTLYAQEKKTVPVALMIHEQVHKDQVKREGPIKFFSKYIYYAITRGHDQNPYEREAEKKSGTF